MGASQALVVPARLKRENCKSTKHDRAFSEWKILVGPSDWEDHTLGKEGAARYRVHNLPHQSSCPGIYELGIAVPHGCSGRELGKCDSDSIIPVYLGQAENVRTRLQRYGQAGAHLENGNLNCELKDCVQKGPGLFTETFSKGFAIVYRWAPMKNKREAEKMEAKLLDTFDYAWNKGSNGARRSRDILEKLGTLGIARSPVIGRKLRALFQKQVGVRIKACEPLCLEDGSCTHTDPGSNDLFCRIFKFGRSQPRLVSMTFHGDHANICGVAIGHGSVCRRPPVEGRKRCAEHKGMKVNGFLSKFITQGETKEEGDVSIKTSITSNPESDGSWAPGSCHYTPRTLPVTGSCHVNEDASPICGFILDDGSQCRMPPPEGRKSCGKHNGRKVRTPPVSATEGKKYHVHDRLWEHSASCNDYERVSPEKCKTGTPYSKSYQQRSAGNKEYNTTCGVDFPDGTFCTRQPVVGRKRCEEHKGMKVKESLAKSSTSYIPTVVEEFSSRCGAPTVSGSFCGRQPANGMKRCWQHIGMRADSSLSYTYSTVSTHTCGAALQNGSICSRMPVPGRKRCEQHKGRRAAS